MSKIFHQIKTYANGKNLPIIPIKPSNVAFIGGPRVFYKTLLDQVQVAKHRVALSALYIGAGSKEEVLLQNLCDNLRENNQLEVKITLDANRANRLDSQGKSSITILKETLMHSRTKLNLIQTYKTSSIFKRILGRFQKWNEILSTYHSKFAVFDNDVIITGANLSSIYFEQRQDRYMGLRDTKLLSNYLYNLPDQISKKDTVRSLKSYNINFIESLDVSLDDSDSFIIPLNQHAPSGLHDNDDFLRFLDSILPASTQVYMSSGYFNPNESISNIKIDHVLAPSEEANGFYCGGGLLKYVPRLYSVLYREFRYMHQPTKLCVYNRKGWSFHAKGIWIDGPGDLCIHFIGSSNFNCRSSDRDFETQFLIVTTNKKLAEELRHERAKLWEHSRPLEAQDLGGLNLIHSLAARILKTFL